MLVMITSVVGILVAAAATGGWVRLLLAMVAACVSAATVAHAATEPVPLGWCGDATGEHVARPAQLPSVRAG
ncbi:MAG TPA: hypothetical protein VFP54_09350 [Acidimicrobiales bacterium]|nr:hypothetical protein [Acidimicrobiales bacterium]